MSVGEARLARSPKLLCLMIRFAFGIVNERFGRVVAWLVMTVLAWYLADDKMELSAKIMS